MTEKERRMDRFLGSNGKETKPSIRGRTVDEKRIGENQMADVRLDTCGYIRHKGQNLYKKSE